MAKSVFKNKRLLRNLFILTLFLIVGFFVWRALFRKTHFFEGLKAAPPPTPASNPKPKPTPASNPTPTLETCKAGTSKINQYYPLSGTTEPTPSGTCPQGYSGPEGNPKKCVWKNWSEPHSKCNIHVPTWEKCTNGQSLYDACIKS